MLDKEDGEDFVVDVVGDIIDSALNVIYDNYIQTQLFPYTVLQARDAILQIIEVSYTMNPVKTCSFCVILKWDINWFYIESTITCATAAYLCTAYYVAKQLIQLLYRKEEIL